MRHHAGAWGAGGGDAFRIGLMLLIAAAGECNGRERDHLQLDNRRWHTAARRPHRLGVIPMLSYSEAQALEGEEVYNGLDSGVLSGEEGDEIVGTITVYPPLASPPPYLRLAGAGLPAPRVEFLASSSAPCSPRPLRRACTPHRPGRSRADLALRALVSYVVQIDGVKVPVAEFQPDSSENSTFGSIIFSGPPTILLCCSCCAVIAPPASRVLHLHAHLPPLCLSCL